MLSRDELRKKRLAALNIVEKSATFSSNDEPADDKSCDHLLTRNLETEELNEIWSVVWPANVKEDDMRRWHSQSFNFSNKNSIPFIIEQNEGGPCGVLAAVQAEMMRLLIFSNNSEGKYGLEHGEIRPISESEVEKAFVQTICIILERAATTERISTHIVEHDRDFISLVSRVDSPHCGFIVEKIDVYEKGIEEAIGRIVHQLRGDAGGIILFLLSLILSRGIHSIKSDMDMDHEARLTGEYGHCTQELLNLLLCGCAVSNAHDGKKLIGDMILNGIPSRPNVGYLSHLEYLRYVEIGDYYKTPQDPVWVIGSSSHFTVLFGIDRKLIEESESKKLFERVRRVFQLEDSSSSGFIQVTSLQKVLQPLLPDIADDVNGMKLHALAGKLEMAGAGIIIWSDFWRVISKLLTGVSFNEAMGFDPSDSPNEQVAKRFRSDSDFAKELQAELNGNNVVTDAARERSDSELARQLQKQFDGTTKNSSTGVVTRSKSLQRSDSIALEDAPSIVLYHINGMKSGNKVPTLSRCLLQRREEVSEIGQDALMWSGNVGGIADVCPINEVLRTRWPGCRVNWDNGNPPSVH